MVNNNNNKVVVMVINTKIDRSIYLFVKSHKSFTISHIKIIHLRQTKWNLDFSFSTTLTYGFIRVFVCGSSSENSNNKTKKKHISIMEKNHIDFQIPVNFWFPLFFQKKKNSKYGIHDEFISEEKIEQNLMIIRCKCWRIIIFCLLLLYNFFFVISNPIMKNGKRINEKMKIIFIIIRLCNIFSSLNLILFCWNFQHQHRKNIHIVKQSSISPCWNHH